jgi:hypothetical protein
MIDALMLKHVQRNTWLRTLADLSLVVATPSQLITVALGDYYY